MQNSPATVERGTGEGKTAVLRYLSGTHRGRVVELRDKTMHIIRGAEPDIRIAPADGVIEADCIATLHRSGSTYELEIIADNEVWVNGERVTSKVLGSGDLLELGHTGPVLRFRLYPPGVAPKKTLAEAFSDSLNGARSDGRSNIGKAGWFFTRFAQDLVTQTTLFFRLGVLLLIALLVVSVVVLIVQSYRFEKRLSTEAVRIEGIANLLQKTGAEAIKKSDFIQLRKQVEVQLEQAVQRVESLEARSDIIARTLAKVTPSVAFVQGSFGFVDPASGQRLRYIESPEGVYLFTLDERAALVELPFTGTAFAVNGERILLTNKHVAEPWLADERAKMPDEHGLRPMIVKMRAFFPGIAEPVDVDHLKSDDAVDLALLQARASIDNITVLEFVTDKPKPGDEVLVVGYPLGMAGMLARAKPQFIEEISSNADVDFWSVGEGLSAAGYIKPLASRGIVSQLSDHYVVFDAETAIGGSGGPVLNLDGGVVGINTAVVKGFGGSNLGVLSIFAERLLKQAAPADE